MKAGAAQQRNDEARDDSGPESLLRCDARSDAEPNRQWQRDQSDRESRAKVRKKDGKRFTYRVKYVPGPSTDWAAVVTIAGQGELEKRGSLASGWCIATFPTT